MMSASPTPLRVGLVGCSWFAIRAHIPALLTLERAVGLCELVAVCSRTKKSMAKAEARIKALSPEREVRRHAKLETMLSDSTVDAGTGTARAVRRAGVSISRS